MKIKKLKFSMLLLAAMVIVIAVNAQKSSPEKKSDRNSSYEVNKDSRGKLKESIRTFDNDKEYRFDLLNGKLTDLYVDGTKITVDRYSEYGEVVNRIKEQVRKDKIRAEIDQARAKNNQKQAIKNQAQAMKEQVDAKLDQKKAMEEQANAKNNREQAMKNEIGLGKDHALVKIDQEHAMKNQEQAEKNEMQARINQQQAFEDERLMKSMVGDLITDGIITDEKDLFSVNLNSTEMTVNGQKQPDEVYPRYKEKYKRFAAGNFNYNNNPGGNKGLRMNRGGE
jgi:hypothetical protein